MELNNIDNRQVKLSDIRPLREAHQQKWTSESTQVLPEPEDGYLPEEQRQAYLEEQYKKHEAEKAVHKMGNELRDILSGDDFLKSDSAVATSENSTVLADVKEDAESAETKNAPKTISMDMSTVFGRTAEPYGEIKKKMKYRDKQHNFNRDRDRVRDRDNSGDRDRGGVNGGNWQSDGVPKGNSGNINSEQTATIGCFNIEWLGTKKRSEEDYETIAQVIKDTGSCLMGVEEISSLQGLKKVLNHLPGWGYILGKSGDQMVGVIFDKSRVTYDANSITQMENMTLGNPGLRPPLSVDMKVDNFDFNFTVIHTKARMDDKSKEVRRRQFDMLNEWMTDRVKNDTEKDYIVVGDYNDFIDSEALQTFDQGDIVEYATQEAAENGVYSNIPFKSLIDHGALSNVEGGAVEEFVPGTTRTVDEGKYYQYEERVSDHKPIVFDVKSGKDND